MLPTANGLELESVTPFVDAVRPVTVVVARLLFPEIDNDPPFIKPEAVRLVDETLVAVTPWRFEAPPTVKDPTLAKPVALKLVLETFPRVDCPVTVKEAIVATLPTLSVLAVTNPLAVKSVVETLASVVVAVTRNVPTTCRVVEAVALVPTAKRLFVLSQLKRLLELNPPEPFENWRRPAVPEAEPPVVTAVPFQYNPVPSA